MWSVMLSCTISGHPCKIYTGKKKKKETTCSRKELKVWGSPAGNVHVLTTLAQPESEERDGCVFGKNELKFFNGLSRYFERTEPPESPHKSPISKRKLCSFIESRN